MDNSENKLQPQTVGTPQPQLDSERARAEAITAAQNSGRKHRKNGRDQIEQQQLDKSYHKTISLVQSQLTMGSRYFSKFIHAPVIETTCSILANTIARPNALLAGSVTMFVLTLAAYATSKAANYNLSGSEAILAFFIGWLAGIIYDYIRLLIKGKSPDAK